MKCLHLIAFTVILSHVFSQETMTNEKALEIVRKNGCKLETLDIAFRANRKIVMEAINNCPTALEFASKELRKDEKLVEKALRNNSKYDYDDDVFQWVDDSL